MMLLRKWLKRFHGSQSGAALVEAAVVLPVIAIIMGGIYDFGRAYATLSAAQKSLRGAVRYLTLQPSGLVCSNWGVANAKNLALYGNIGGTGTLLIPGWQAANISLDLPVSCSSTTAVGVIKMSATVPYSSLMWGIVGLPNTITMTTQHQERWIGQ